MPLLHFATPLLPTVTLLYYSCRRSISFGDNYNDMEMIQSTGLGIAMGNAVPELKQAADFVTLSNQEDGVAYVLEALFG